MQTVTSNGAPNAKTGAKARKPVALIGRLKPPSSTVAHAFSRRPALLTPNPITKLPDYPITNSPYVVTH
jgi:hypothetical protein